MNEQYELFIDSLEPGPELDALVADKIFHQPFRKPTHGNCCTCQTCGHGHDECRCDYGLADWIGRTWEIVDELRRLFDFALSWHNGSWVASFRLKENYCVALARHASIAIVRAALKTVEMETAVWEGGAK